MKRSGMCRLRSAHAGQSPAAQHSPQPRICHSMFRCGASASTPAPWSAALACAGCAARVVVGPWLHLSHQRPAQVMVCSMLQITSFACFTRRSTLLPTGAESPKTSAGHGLQHAADNLVCLLHTAQHPVAYRG